MIHAQDLTMTFKGGVEAVRGISLDVAPGEIVGFLGPNGAGKSTTMRMLATLLRPTSGTATVAGHDLLSDPSGVRRGIGYVGQGTSVAPFTPIGEELVLQAQLAARLGLDEARARVRELMALLDLEGLEHRIGASLSGGQQRRVDLAFGLLHKPSLLILDEPSTGLDPASRAALWEHVKGLGITVLLSTHYLEEADALCDRLYLIDKGVVTASGTPAELKAGRTLDEFYLEATR
ncbi:ABC transporter ATP-binding protein [Nonomuraea soli]|uniref:ABC-2 type transport system ATP-binding protein n=1 Tax=Nonomuraea soli TaxID=1032476 RepID=A0A7W0CGL4_9ACTN|nr:ABC transporter ATP-binding protein [Nonomuraea soli]MBA2890654.1 ABC-2 type transport system ATP-binding protein [Nonomuraea soli]